MDKLAYFRLFSQKNAEFPWNPVKNPPSNSGGPKKKAKKTQRAKNPLFGVFFALNTALRMDKLA